MYLVLALSSAIVYGVGDWCGGRAARHQATLVVVAVGQAVSLVLVALLAVAGSATSPDAVTWAWSAAGGAVGALGIVALYHGFANGAVTVVAPVSAVVSAVVPVVAGLLIGERPSGGALAGIVVAVIAVALVSGAVGRRERTTSWRTVVVALAAGTCFGLLFLCLERTADGSGMWPLLIARLASVPMLFALVLSSRGRPTSGGAGLRIAVAAGVLDMAANVLYLLAVREGLMAIVAVIVSLYPASTVAMAFAVDRERVTRWQAVGLALAASSLAIVSLAQR